MATRRTRHGLKLVLSSALAAVAALGFASGCGAASCPGVEAPAGEPPMLDENGQAMPSGPATPEEADAFVAKVNEELKDLWVYQERAAWVKTNFITEDTETLEARANEQGMEYLSRKIKEAKRFDGLKLKPETARALYLLKFAAGLPAPEDEKERKELSEISSKLEGIYGRGKYCSDKLIGKGKDKKEKCLGVDELGNILKDSRDYGLLVDVWKGWRSISPEMRPMYERFVTLGNKGSKELGFADMGEIWRGGYDMSSSEFKAEMDRLWSEVKPLYEDLHCYVRGKLSKQYGADKVPDKGPIPAHILGNMWAQEWSGIYPLVEPYPGKSLPDLTKQLKAKKYDEMKMVKLGESFFTSLGMDPLPKTFWERSLFLKPKDREVVCHASAWDVNMAGDLRIKMCIQVNEEDLITIHHELGHNYYFHYYNKLPALFQSGANDGFHEGIGDTLVLSVTPEYLTKIGLYDKVPESKEADVNVLMKRALDGVAFLPFGKLIDEWRWDVFSGATPPGKYNAAWWEKRLKYQGVVPPVTRNEQDFDPGAKFHIPGNTPYTRYFIARILQYQFHRALCKASGYTGPLHKCSIYGNKAAGEKMMAMLRLGASRPWQEALATLGEKKMDATAILDYYAPLQAWLKEQNKGKSCGW